MGLSEQKKLNLILILLLCNSEERLKSRRAQKVDYPLTHIAETHRSGLECHYLLCAYSVKTKFLGLSMLTPFYEH